MGAIVAAQQARVLPAQIAHDVRKHLTSLPYYGPFDLITYHVDADDEGVRDEVTIGESEDLALRANEPGSESVWAV